MSEGNATIIYFELFAWRWTLTAREPISFSHAGNTIRGALGMALARSSEAAAWFRPRLHGGPSGLAHPPRPFVIRASHLDGKSVVPGESFWLDIHCFEAQRPPFGLLCDTMQRIGDTGIGRGRGRARISAVAQLDSSGHSHSVTQLEPVRIILNPPIEAVHRSNVRFVTPTDLKGSQPDEPVSFGILFARARDRVSTLNTLYGAGRYALDFHSLGERSRAVRTLKADLARVSLSRRSTRTGQTHTLGGVTGMAEYEGDLTEFLPWLQAAQWTGVGRQTVWGNGQIEVLTSKPD